MAKKPQLTGTEQRIIKIQDTLKDTIGSHLNTIYHLERPTPDGSNMVIAVETHHDLHLLRQALRPAQPTNGLNPIIATNPALTRHLQLDSFLNALIHKEEGHLLAGQRPPTQLQTVPPAEMIGLLCGLAMEASEILTPALLKPGEYDVAIKKLKNLSTYLEIEIDLDSPGLRQTQAAVQARLASLVENQPQAKWSIPAPTGAPALIDALLAIYERQDRVIFVLPDWSPQKIEDYLNKIDWTAVSDSLIDQYNGLQITTATQFRLMLQYDKTADFYLQNYTHAWGINVLSSFEAPRWHIYRDLARLASTFEVHIFARAYLFAADDEINTLVHDFQNRLLNIQLREELMHRLFNQERALPPIPLPGKEASGEEKVIAIFKQFGWWADHYTGLMTAHK